jgi:hypothetical protein
MACRLFGKRAEPVYVYAIVWGPNLGNEGIKRYAVHRGRNRYFIHPFSFDFIPLPKEWNPEAFHWRFVGVHHDPVRQTIEPKAGYWFAAGAFPDKYYSLKQIESQWRKLQTEATAEQDPLGDWEDILDILEDQVDPRRKAQELLGVSRDATPADIRSAYRKKALVHHPDHGGDAKIFAQLSAAYELLSRGHY